MLNRNCLIFVFSLFLIGAIFGCFNEVSAQATSGTILGQITDAQSAVVPQATVTAKNVDTGLTQTVETNDNGEYALLNLPPGNYAVTITKTGFSTATSANKVSIDQKLRLNIQMTVGEVSANVEVTSEAPLLQTQTTETSQVVETKRITDLPLLGRNFLDLMRQSPGVTSGAAGSVNNIGISVNGQREFNNSFVVDGIEVSSNRNNDTSLRPSVDSVQEFKILTSAYAPEFGKASGAVVTIQTKSGTNSFHGSLYEFFRPSAAAANKFSFNSTQDVPNLNQHNFGGTIGGPIFKNKTFFFASYEGIRKKDSFAYPNSVPPTGQIKFLANGDVDLSGLRDPNTGNQVPLFDPAYFASNYSPQRFAGNIIPANRVSPAGKAILQKLFPQPNLAGSNFGNYLNYFYSSPYRYNSNTLDFRVDHTFSERDRLSVVYHYSPFNSQQGALYDGTTVADAGGLDWGYDDKARNHSLSVTETHVFSNSLLNEFRFGLTRFNYASLPLVTDSNASNNLGIKNTNLPGFPDTYGLPYLAVGSSYYTGGSDYRPLNFFDTNLQFTDNVSKQIGAHSVKAGFELRYLNARPKFSLIPTGYTGFYDYNSLTSDPTANYFVPGTDYGGFYDPAAAFYAGGSAIADLLLGLPGYTLVGLQLTDPRTKSHETNFYAQDSWQVNKKLVLNYGVRYEYQSPYSEKDNQASNFDPATKQLLLAGQGGNSKYLIKPDKNNFMPRVGLAYQINEKTVLRTGYGIFYSPSNDARSDRLTKNYPFATSQIFSNDPYSLNFTLDTGVPRPTSINIPSGASSINAVTIPNANKSTFYYIDPAFETGYSQLFNVVLQRELFKNFTVEAGYVGSVSHKLSYDVGDLNRNSRISSQLGKISAQFSEGNANYHSMQLKADKRFSKGMSFFVAYTFSKCIDNGVAPLTLGRNTDAPQDPFNLKAERGLCTNDIKHNLTSSIIYDLPIGKGKHFLNDANGVVNAILGGWQVNGIFTARSGLPINVIRNGQDIVTLRPDLVGNPTLDNPTLDKWFNTAAFVSPLNASALGNAGRNLIRGPGYGNFDASLFKKFSLAKFREGTEFELRFEFFNLTNTPHFANPNSVIGKGDFGKITQTIGNARIIQFAGKINF